MKSKMSIKSIVFITIISLVSSFFINMSLAADTAKIRVETANLRESMEEDAKILEQLSIDEEVEVIEKTGDWYKVKAQGIIGYLRQDLINIKQEAEKKESDENNVNQVETNEATQEPSVNEPEKLEQEQNQVPEENSIKQEETSTQQTKTEEQELGKKQIVEDTKLKIIPVINATSTSEVKKLEEVNVIEIMNGWACIETKSTKGWVRKEKLQKLEQKPEPTIPAEPTKPEEEQPTKPAVSKTLFINAARVNVRKEANTTSEIITKVTINTAVEVIEETNGWSKVKINGKEGYISSSLLATKKQEETSRSKATPRKATDTTNKETNTAQEKTEAPATQTVPVSGNGDAIVAYAKQFIGTKYTYGGSSPSTGFDCSGFTSYVFRNFGVSLPRTSGGQAGAGVAVSRSNLVAGDLIIYSGHVAIYVGGGQVIHAPRPGKSVCIVPINQAASNYLGARRVL